MKRWRGKEKEGSVKGRRGGGIGVKGKGRKEWKKREAGMERKKERERVKRKGDI